MSSTNTSIFSLEYQEVGGDALALPQVSSAPAAESTSSAMIGVPEEEVERRIQIARDCAVAEAEQRMRVECERAARTVQQRIAEVVKEFEGERAEYFKRAEGEVVGLALAIARKILQREAELDPTLLAALVRIALDRMQCGSMVRIRVSEKSADLWRRFGDANAGSSQWEILLDETLNAGDCIVETELGTANFGFEAQLTTIQESFAQLLAHRPNAHSRHAAAA